MWWIRLSNSNGHKYIYPGKNICTYWYTTYTFSSNILCYIKEKNPQTCITLTLRNSRTSKISTFPTFLNGLFDTAASTTRARCAATPLEWITHIQAQSNHLFPAHLSLFSRQWDVRSRSSSAWIAHHFSISVACLCASSYDRDWWWHETFDTLSSDPSRRVLYRRLFIIIQKQTTYLRIIQKNMCA